MTDGATFFNTFGPAQSAAHTSPTFDPAVTADADTLAAASDAATAHAPLHMHPTAPCSMQCVRLLLRSDLDTVLRSHHDEIMQRLQSWAEKQEQRLFVAVKPSPPTPKETSLPGSVSEAEPPPLEVTERETLSVMAATHPQTVPVVPAAVVPTMPADTKAQWQSTGAPVEPDWAARFSKAENRGPPVGKRASESHDIHAIKKEQKPAVHSSERRPSRDTNYTNDGKTRASKQETGLLGWLHRSMTQHEQTAYSESRRKSQAVKAAVLYLHRSTHAFAEEATWAQQKVQKVVGHNLFEFLVCALIVTNTVFFGVEVQHAAHYGVNNAPGAFDALKYIYTTLFALELILRVFAHGFNFFVSKFWAWNYLDLLIVLLSLVEAMLDVVNSQSENEVDGGGNLAYIRIIRIFRTVRVLRVVRLMRFFRALRILIYSIVHTLKSLMWTLCLLVAIMYVFGVLFTQATAQHLSPQLSARGFEHSSLQKYYGTLPRSMFTLFMCISGGVDWEMVIEPLREIHPFWVTLFIAFVSFTFFAVLNVVTGVFCQNAIESAAHDRDMVVQAQLASKESYIQELTNLFQSMDCTHSGALTIEEFEEHFYDPRVQAYFNSLEMHLSDAWTLFKLLDNDDSRLVNITEFVEGCVRLKGTARSLDMAAMRYEQKWMLTKLNKFMIYVEEQFVAITRKLEGPQKAKRTPLLSQGTRELVKSSQEQADSSKDSSNERSSAQVRRSGTGFIAGAVTADPERPSGRVTVEADSRQEQGRPSLKRVGTKFLANAAGATDKVRLDSDASAKEADSTQEDGRPSLKRMGTGYLAQTNLPRDRVTLNCDASTEEADSAEEQCRPSLKRMGTGYLANTDRPANRVTLDCDLSVTEADSAQEDCRPSLKRMGTGYLASTDKPADRVTLDCDLSVTEDDAVQEDCRPSLKRLGTGYLASSEVPVDRVSLDCDFSAVEDDATQKQCCPSLRRSGTGYVACSETSDISATEVTEAVSTSKCTRVQLKAESPTDSETLPAPKPKRGVAWDTG